MAASEAPTCPTRGNRRARSFLCICAWCKRIKVDDDRWEPADECAPGEPSATLTHGLCPLCAARFERVGRSATLFGDGMSGTLP